jgi:hypothetical protein
MSKWRGWAAAVAAYALVLQALLGAVLASQVPVGADPFVICAAHEDGAPVDQGSGKAPSHDMCALCTLAMGSHAILAGGAASPAPRFAYVTLRNQVRRDRIAVYHSPTGQYQRGPPQRVIA